MRPYLLHLPEHEADLAGWLEDELVAGRAAELADESRVVFGNGEAGATLDGLLGDELPAVYRDGLGAASSDRLFAIVRNPALLRELDARILEFGGPYWTKRLQEHDDPAAAERVWKRIAGDLHPARASTAPPSAAASAKRWGMYFAVAAAILLCFGVGYLLRPKSALGWQDDRLYSLALPAKDYGVRLADSALEFRPPPDASRSELLALLDRIDDGCARFAAAQHRSVPKAVADDLVQSCEKWRGAFRDFGRQLKAGGDLALVRGRIDDQVQRMAAKIREKTSA